MTGTPVENSLADFWCLMDTACPGYLDSYQNFRNEYISPILRAGPAMKIEHVRGIVGRQLRERVGALMLRRVKEDNLDGLQKRRYLLAWRIRTGLICHLYIQFSRMVSWSRMTPFSRTSRVLKQISPLDIIAKAQGCSLHPRLVFGGGLDASGEQGEVAALMYESGKFQSLLSILDDIKKRKEKCIIFVINKRLQVFLSLALTRTYLLPPISIINGDAKAVAKRAGSPTRKSLIKTFEDKEGFNIIIMSPVAAAWD